MSTHLMIFAIFLFNVYCEPLKDVQDSDLLVVKDASINCKGTTGKGDIGATIKECKNGGFDAFQFTGNDLKICEDFDILQTTPLKSLPGTYTVIHKRVFELLGTNVILDQDFECSGLPIDRNSESLQKLIQEVDNGSNVSINLIGDSFRATQCWTLGERTKKEGNVILLNVRGMIPRTTRLKTRQCFINGSIQPDDYNLIYYAGDVVPASL